MGLLKEQLLPREHTRGALLAPIVWIRSQRCLKLLAWTLEDDKILETLPIYHLDSLYTSSGQCFKM